VYHYRRLPFTSPITNAEKSKELLKAEAVIEPIVQVSGESRGWVPPDFGTEASQSCDLCGRELGNSADSKPQDEGG
jgi:hypothetical protein